MKKGSQRLLRTHSNHILTQLILAINTLHKRSWPKQKNPIK